MKSLVSRRQLDVGGGGGGGNCLSAALGFVIF